MIDIHEGEPSEEKVQGIAAEVARAEAWAKPTKEEVTTFLFRLMSREQFAGAVPTENVFILTFVIAANILSS